MLHQQRLCCSRRRSRITSYTHLATLGSKTPPTDPQSSSMKVEHNIEVETNTWPVKESEVLDAALVFGGFWWDSVMREAKFPALFLIFVDRVWNDVTLRDFVPP